MWNTLNSNSKGVEPRITLDRPGQIVLPKNTIEALNLRANCVKYVSFAYNKETNQIGMRLHKVKTRFTRTLKFVNSNSATIDPGASFDNINFEIPWGNRVTFERQNDVIVLNLDDKVKIKRRTPTEE